MLYSFQYIDHDFKKLHKFIEHTVLEVWCKPNGNFNINKLHKDFQPIVTEVRDNAAKRKNGIDYLYKPIQNIYRICNKLDAKQLKKLSTGFKANNAVQDLCEGRKTPLLFEEVKKISPQLHNALQKFGKTLYTNAWKLAPCKSRTGDLNDHYGKFVTQNKSELCPFCGLEDIKTKRLKVRDAFDHYLSKDKYPFISINLHNLAPMCHDCNSVFKNQDDPIKKDKKRRKSFYPLAGKKPLELTNIKITVDIETKDIKNIQLTDIDVTFSHTSKQEEVDTWDDIFKVGLRYKDKFCKEKDGKHWYKRIADECANYGKTAKELYEIERKVRKKSPFSEDNFIRVPFLEGCNRKGLFK